MPAPRFAFVVVAVALSILPGLRAAEAPHALDLGRVFPAPGAMNVPPDAPLRFAFTAPPTLGHAGKISIHDAATGAVVEAIEVGAPTATKSIGGVSYQYYPVLVNGADVTVVPKAALGYDKSYFVTLDAGAFENVAALSDAQAWRFATKKSAPDATVAKLVVAADGRGDFCTVQGAIDFVPAENARPITLELRRGEYVELVNVPRGKNHLTLRGEDREESIISYANNARFNPRMRALMDVTADDFRLENLTLRNTTPKGGSQAETIRLRADRAVLAHCDFSSLQDTLQISGRVYVDDCFVEGDVDFVWGYGAVYFNHCELKALNAGYLVQSRNTADKLGYVFVDCRLTAAPGVTRYILARIEPSRFPASHVAFINCAMGPHIAPVGWQFDRAPNAKELGSVEHERFEEFQSVDLQGKPLDVSQRLASARQLTLEEAAKLRDVNYVLGGTDNWNPTARR